MARKTTIRQTTVDGRTVKFTKEPAPDRGAEHLYRVVDGQNRNIVDPVTDKNQGARNYFAVVEQYEERGAPGTEKREEWRENNLQGVETTSETTKSSDGNFATGFSRKVNEFVKGGSKSNDDNGGGGGFQEFATSFAEGVNQTVAGSSESSDESEEDAGGQDPLGMLLGGGQQSDDDDESDGPQLAFMGGGMGGGGDNQPYLPGFGMGPQDDDDEDSSQGPQMPMFGGAMGGENGGNQPYLPGFGMGPQQDSEDDEEQKQRNSPPWMP